MSHWPTTSPKRIIPPEPRRAPNRTHRALVLVPGGGHGCEQKRRDHGAHRRSGSQVGKGGSRTGIRHRLRDLNGNDVTELSRFHDRCSEETHYRRFLTAKPRLLVREAEQFCNVDQHRDGAIVALDPDSPDKIRGVGRWFGVDATSAEVAFAVEDDYQGCGIGRSLVSTVIALARSVGFTILIGYVLADNRAMRYVLRTSGYPLVEHYDGPGVLAFSLDVSGETTLAA